MLNAQVIDGLKLLSVPWKLKKMLNLNSHTRLSLSTYHLLHRPCTWGVPWL